MSKQCIAPNGITLCLLLATAAPASPPHDPPIYALPPLPSLLPPPHPNKSAACSVSLPTQHDRKAAPHLDPSNVTGVYVCRALQILLVPSISLFCQWVRGEWWKPTRVVRALFWCSAACSATPGCCFEQTPPGIACLTSHTAVPCSRSDSSSM